MCWYYKNDYCKKKKKGGKLSVVTKSPEAKCPNTSIDGVYHNTAIDGWLKIGVVMKHCVRALASLALAGPEGIGTLQPHTDEWV